MKILAIETATDACSAALYIDGQIHNVFAIAPRQHTQLILAQIEAVLAQAEIKLTQVDALAFGCGPGAFTGLRIAAGVTQGLALAADIPAIAVSSLAAMAQRAYDKYQCEKMYIGLDARMQQVYWGEYHIQDGYSVLQGKEQVIAPQDLSASTHTHDAIQDKTSEFFGIGSAWHVYEQELCHTICAKNHTKLHAIYPSAEYVAYLAVVQYKKKQYLHSGEIQPVYLRNKVAQTLIERSKA
jgi:tRNA threonylcarbamoyladenosine biosynthesis protein TsaB